MYSIYNSFECYGNERAQIAATYKQGEQIADRMAEEIARAFYTPDADGLVRIPKRDEDEGPRTGFAREVMHLECLEKTSEARGGLTMECIIDAIRYEAIEIDSAN